MEQRLVRTALWFLKIAAVCLGLSGCQTVVSPTWTVPSGVSTQTVNGYPLAYTARGAGPTIVFVHGVLGDYRYWQAPLDTWTTDFRVIAISMRHFYPEKWNGKGNDFTTAQHTKDLIAFIEATGGPVYLVGWSYGGRAAYEVARARPDLVKKLVLVEAGFDPDIAPTGVSLNTAFLKLANATAKFFDAGDMDGGLQFAIDSINGPGVWAKVPEPIRQVIRDNAWTVVGGGRETYSATCADFGSLKMPVLLVTGDLTTPRNGQNVQGQSKCLPQATVARIPKAGHPSPSMNPPAFKEAVVTFLQH
jgi:pimeloyl-ACP methyl ester carboxylesterase